jgi:hypothetical protein
MEENEKTTEYVKYHFSETEKKEIATEMAQKVTDLNGAEDEKKAIASDFKSRIDGLQANINAAATKLNTPESSEIGPAEPPTDIWINGKKSIETLRDFLDAYLPK